MPTIQTEKCTKCMKCVKDCPSNAITIENGFISDDCIHCGHCVAICPEQTIVPDSGMIMTLQPQTITAEAFRHLSAGIRSHRRYLTRMVPDEILLQLVENMKHYPSASNTRQLQVTILKNPAQIKLLNDLTEQALISKLEFYTSPIIRPLIKLLKPGLDTGKLDRYKDTMKERRSKGDAAICHHAPAVMLFHGPAGETGMLEADANIWATYTSIYANTLGLATCFIGFIVLAMGKNSKLNSKFAIPSGHRVYASIVIGYPKNKYLQESGRKAPDVNLI